MAIDLDRKRAARKREAKQQPVTGTEDGAATGRQDQICACGQLLQHGRLARSKARFTLELEDHRNAHTRALLDHLIRIAENFAQPARKQLANRSLARAHHPHQKYVGGKR